VNTAPALQPTPNHGDLLLELEARQDEVLAQLDGLNLRLEQVLAEYSPPVPSPAAQFPANTTLIPSKAA
jgi:hypothetical protein